MSMKQRARRWADKLATDNEPGLTTGQLMLTNHDLKPVEPARRQWGAWNYVGFWISDAFNVNTWMIASVSVSDGLAWWQAWLCVWIGYAIAGCFIASTGRIGATYHIGFPVVGRASFGIWGTLWPVLNRAAMACIWYGVQSWIGGECVYYMIAAIWPSAMNIPKTFTTPGLQLNFFIGFILFWVGSLPFLWFPVHKIRHLFTVKSFIVPTVGIAFLIWMCCKAGGIGPIVKQPATITGSTLAWTVIQGIMSSIANFATLIVNDPDFARFAQKPSNVILPQLITIPVSFAVTSFIGIIVSSSSTVIFGKTIWNPLDILDFLLQEGGSGNRAGVFFVAMAFTLAQLGTNIAANSVSAGTDMTALFPRYINIRRGSYICAIIGICINPWYLLSSASSFTTYLSAYAVFLSSIAGVIICDYYVVRKGYLLVEELYSASSDGMYWYTLGVNWRAYVAYICGILINVVGFAGAVGTPVPIGATYIYRLDFFTGFIVASGTYWVLNYFFKVPGRALTWTEVSDSSVEGTGYDEEYSMGAEYDTTGKTGKTTALSRASSDGRNSDS